MRVAVTGHRGYIGGVLVPLLLDAGHEVVGIDTDFYTAGLLGPEPPTPHLQLRLDVREVQPEHLRGCEAVIHLAALSNDPLGDLAPEITSDINLAGTLQVARSARAAGATRFLFASSCSLYGAGDPDGPPLDEGAAFAPVTPYGQSKIDAEHAVAELAGDDFSPTFLRNATVYGFSPNLRVDIMVNSLTGYAVTTGEVVVLSDGTPWRPLVHIGDVARAFEGLMTSDRDTVHGLAVNVGRNDGNHQVREVADLVGEVTGAGVVYAPGGTADRRDYRVDFGLLGRVLPGFEARMDVRSGIEELAEAYRRFGLTKEEFLGGRFTRLATLRSHLDTGRLDDSLRWLT